MENIQEELNRSMSAKPPARHFRLLYFASAASYTKKSSDDFPAPLAVTELFGVLEAKYKGITECVLSCSAVTVNLGYVDMVPDPSNSAAGVQPNSIVIEAGDEVAIIPPVSSG